MDLFSNNNIENEFQKLVKWSETHKMQNKNTGMETVLQFLLDHPEKIWWWSYEFGDRINSKGGFLSHRACARASDLAIKYPDLVEDRKIGKLAVYRLRTENMDKIKEFLK